MSTRFPQFIFSKQYQHYWCWNSYHVRVAILRYCVSCFNIKATCIMHAKKSDISIEHIKLSQIVLTSFCRLCLDSLKCVIDVCVTLYFVHFYLFPLHFRFLSAQNKRAAFEFVVSLNITSSTTRPIYTERKNIPYHSAAKTSIF